MIVKFTYLLTKTSLHYPHKCSMCLAASCFARYFYASRNHIISSIGRKVKSRWRLCLSVHIQTHVIKQNCKNVERIAMNIINTVLIYFLYLWSDNNHSYIAYWEHIKLSLLNYFLKPNLKYERGNNLKCIFQKLFLQILKKEL